MLSRSERGGVCMFGCMFLECRCPDMSVVCTARGEENSLLEGATGGSGRELAVDILRWNFGSCGASDGVRELDNREDEDESGVK
jgi:hypothetical protein